MKPSKISAAVVRVFQESWKDIVSSSRQKQLVEPRRAYCYLMRKHTKLGIINIGDTIGRHHATVIHFSKTAKDYLSTDKEFQMKIQQIEAILGIRAPVTCPLCKQEVVIPTAASRALKAFMKENGLS